MINIRKAKIADIKVVYQTISYYAELDRMLFRSMAQIYENIQAVSVAVENDEVVGCYILQVVWDDLAEIKSLAVNKDCQGKGIGVALVKNAIENAAKIGVKKIFALTLEPDFFQQMGFKMIEKDQLPMKVWTDCAKCPKQHKCDETAVIINMQ